MLLGYIGCAEDISERKAAEHDAQRRRQEVDEALAFERLVAGVLAALLIADPWDEDRVIEQGLRDIARHLGVEGAALWERLPDGAAFRITHRWLAEDVPSPPDQLGVPELPWITARLLSGAVVRFSRHSDLPDEASQDLVVLGRLGTRALLAVPFSISGARRRGAVVRERARGAAAGRKGCCRGSRSWRRCLRGCMRAGPRSGESARPRPKPPSCASGLRTWCAYIPWGRCRPPSRMRSISR